MSLLVRNRIILILGKRKVLVWSKSDPAGETGVFLLYAGQRVNRPVLHNKFDSTGAVTETVGVICNKL